MRIDFLKAILRTAVHGATVLLLGAGLATAQQQVNLSAGSSSLTLPNGAQVPMWGYTCGAVVAGSTATCAKANPAAAGWTPVIITVPTGSDLQINLTNNLSFTPTGNITVNNIPTSLVIAGQLGGGLGTTATSTASPDHSTQNSTWPIANNGNTFTPPTQGPRVQSFSTEVGAVAPGTAVTCSTATGASPVTGCASLTWTAPRAGTYLLESGTHPSIQAAMGLIGMVVVTTAPGSTGPGTAGTAYPAVGTTPAVSYNAEVPLLFSEIDPVQNNAVQTAVTTNGFMETMVWSGQPGGCGNPASSTYQQCYPPVVNYTPLYYLINGVAFDKTNPTTSLFAALQGSNTATIAGSVLVRFVNAGLHMHIPSIVGSQTTVTEAANTHGGSTGPSNPANGFSLIAEDGNRLPGTPRVQSEVFMAAGKTYDVMINVPATVGNALPVYDRELSLSANSSGRDAGMLAYVGINASTVGAASGAAVANPDTYNSIYSCAATPCTALVISDPSKGVIANDINVYGVTLLTAPTKGTVALNADGTFTYTPNVGWTGGDTFVYQANGTSGPTATVTLGAAPIEAATGITGPTNTFTANSAKYIKLSAPGLLTGFKDAAGYPLTVAAVPAPAISGSGSKLVPDPMGGFEATVSGAGTYNLTFSVQNSQGTKVSATAMVVFPTANGPVITVLGKNAITGATTPITDYRWIIEEDRTFYVDPKCTTNPPPAGCPTAASGIVPTFGTNFHTSFMPVVATGCTGLAGTQILSCESGQTLLGQPAVCDIGNGVCRTTGTQETPLDPSQVHLDPSKRYYISVLPGDAAEAFESGNATGGHGMGGAPIAAACTFVPPATSCTGTEAPVTVITESNPFPPSKLSVMVFQDDFPLNGEQDAGGGIDVLATNEPGLGGFNITIFDDAGGTGDATGQVDYDMFNQPLSNGLAGTLDPATGIDACPIGKTRTGTNPDGSNDVTQTGISGTIVTCPKFEADGRTLSPLAGQAVISNMMPGRYGVVATPGADRIARGEEWLQTNTLDGQKAHDSFLKIGEASYFQEYGPAGYHVSIGFANPAIINARHGMVCSPTGDGNLQASDCTHTVTGSVSTERMSRTPDERLYGSGSYDSFAFTQCYVTLGDTDGEDFAFTKCNSDGTWSLSNIPSGNWRITVFDQWNDMLVDGLSTPVAVSSTSPSTSVGAIAMNQWQANIYTQTFFDTNGDGVRQDNEPGLALVPTNIRFRDGSYSNFNNTDLDGNAGFNEVFPLFSWYVVETDDTRYKNTGTHVVYDAGGPADGTTCGTSATPPTAPCGKSTVGHFMANTYEANPVPGNLHFPGAVYCTTADCTGQSIANGPNPTAMPNSTGRIDPPWVKSEGWQGFSGQNSFLEFGKTPFATGENGGIHGHVVYASTRPFDDPQLLLQTSWEPLVPGVTINLYQEGTAADGSTSLTLVDTTKTSSWDDWAQGFRSDNIPNMNCPGQSTADMFYFTLQNQPNYLDYYNNQLHGASGATPLPNNSQFKCYDGMHNWNQLQAAPYDGRYEFPSIAGRDPVTGKPVGGTNASVAGTNCAICVANPTDGTPMLPVGKYVVEVVVPPGYELVKEEDKNILIGDNFIAPVTVEFPGLGGSVFILPDQAEVGTAYNSNNAQNPTQDLGRTTLPSHEADTGSMETFWPCVGASRTVPDYISLFPNSSEVSPFAGATRNLCDRKEVTLTDQSAALAKFYIFTSTHAAAHFTGVITDDFTSEFDPFSPQFGEKFSPPNLPISIQDWTGTEIARVYADQWGAFNGLNYSTWEVNPPNPTGYSPTMMVTCMNDPGKGTTPDALFNPGYSQFCYEIPFMPAQTQYMDTPVTPTTAFSEGYNHADCSYPDSTPAISTVSGGVDGDGPYITGATGHTTLTITALADQAVLNNGYSGPSASTPPFNQKTVTRHYGFGNTKGTVSIGGANIPAANITTWNDTTIVLNLTGGTSGVQNSIPNCATQQMSQYGGSSARCGQLVITTATGQQSVDTVTVTIGGKAPLRVGSTQQYKTIQSAIDAAAPGDLILVSPGTYYEMLLMWKPVRLQGSGAASTIINANSQPEGKLDPWRRQVSCLFGLALNGQPYSTAGHLVPLPGGGGNEPLNPYDTTGQFSCPATGWNYFYAGPNNPQVDRIPLEGILGWDTTLNGNLAELLQEPTLMGAYEGAGITVLAKGVRYPKGIEVFGAGKDNTASSNIAHEGQMPAIVNADGTIHGTVMLTNSGTDCATNITGTGTGYSSNFMCNPSRIDGLSITDSSQGGGGIYVHGWAHKLEISNNRIINNSGTLTGGITVGQGESPDALLSGNGGDPVGFDQQPWTCPDLVPGAILTNAGAATGTNQNVSPSGFVAGTQLPYCYNEKVNVHNNSVSLNSSIGDELFSSTPAGAGGVTFAVGSDDYQFNNNWVCGNLSTGDGGGIAHLGFSYNGSIQHNTIIFNQSTNPTVPTNGGGIVVMGAAPDGSPSGAPAGAECGSVTDVDCAPGLTDGTGPHTVINANLIMGNAAESGSGGGIRLQDVNGTDVGRFPILPNRWNSVDITNNIITNNVAGWDGAGISLQDALVANVIYNTVASNDTTASAGVLFDTIGAPESSAPGTNCQNPAGSTASCPQPAGFVTMKNTTLLTASMPALLICPGGHGTIGSLCRNFSVPALYNNVFWQNRSFYIGVGGASTTQPETNQQNTVTLYNAFTPTPAATQPTADATTASGTGSIITGGTGACVSPISYWDIGVRGDTGPANHASGLTLVPAQSVLTDAGDYTGQNNTLSPPQFVSQYCNGSRTPPEFQSLGYQVPPGISDATVPNPVFNLTPAATVDEGNNWINISWGPLAMTNPVTNTILGNYAPTSSSSARNHVSGLAIAVENVALMGDTTVPTIDFFGRARRQGALQVDDVGAIEFVAAAAAPILSVTGGPLNFGNVNVSATSTAQTLTLHNTSATQATGIAVTVTSPFARSTTSPGTCGGTLNGNSTCTINIVFQPTAAGAVTGTVTITATNGSVSGSPVNLSGTGVATTASAVLTPSTWTTSAVDGCVAPNCPMRAFTLTNNGQTTISGIGSGTLTGANANQFAIVPAASTCGSGAGQLMNITTLAPNASCVVTVSFKPTAAGSDTATVSVSYTTGSKTSTLTGTAN